MTEILTFSEKAKFRLKEIMSSNNHRESLGLRISVTSGGCAGMTYKMDYIQKKIDGDEKIKPPVEILPNTLSIIPPLSVRSA